MKNSLSRFDVSLPPVALRLAIAAGLCGCLLIAKPKPATSQSAPVHVVDIAPVGWRRTADGWERAESWSTNTLHSAKPINQWIEIQRSQEASRAQQLLRRLRQVHPLVVAVILLSVVLAVVLLSSTFANLGRQRHLL